VSTWPSWLPHVLTLVTSVFAMYAKSTIEELFVRRAKAEKKRLKREKKARKKERGNEHAQ